MRFERRFMPVLAVALAALFAACAPPEAAQSRPGSLLPPSAPAASDPLPAQEPLSGDALVYENVELRVSAGGWPYLHQTLTNRTGRTLTGVEYCMLAYDETGAPLKLYWKFIDSDEAPSYRCLAELELELAPGAAYAPEGGWTLYDGETMPELPQVGDGGPSRVAYALYCVKSAVFSDGSRWDDPDFDAWLERYEGRTLPPEALASYYPFLQPL